MNNWALFFTTVLVLTLQSTLITMIEISEVQPDIRLIFLVFIALKRGSSTGATIGFFMGLITDIYDYDHLGANALAGTLIGFFAGFANEHVIELDKISRLFFMGLAFVLHDVIFGLSLQSKGLALGPYLVSKTVPSVVYTLLLASVILYFQDTGRKDES